MVNSPDLPEFDKDELVEYAREFESKARERAPRTVKLSYGGVLVGAVAFGPAGGVLGATVGSSIGYLMDEDYFDSEEEPEVVEADIKNS